MEAANKDKPIVVYSRQLAMRPQQMREICRKLHDLHGVPDVHMREIRNMLYNRNCSQYGMPIMKTNPHTGATIWCDSTYIACIDEWYKFAYVVILKPHVLEELRSFAKVEKERGVKPDISPVAENYLRHACKYLYEHGGSVWINDRFRFVKRRVYAESV